MIILDTDHMSVLRYPENSQHAVLLDRMAKSIDVEFVSTAVSVEEQMRGWLAGIRRKRKVHDQILYYARLVGLVRFLGRWKILPFDEPAADLFESFRKQRVRIGTLDLKIACIALSRDSVLLSSNLRDFQQVAGLRVEDWLH